MLRTTHLSRRQRFRAAYLVVTLAILGSACAAGVHGTASGESAGLVRMLLALDVPEPLARVQPQWNYAELVRARPATTYALGLGREERQGEWLAWYRFDDPTHDPSLTFEDNLRQQPAAESRLRRVEFLRDVGGDSAVAVWSRAAMRAVEAGGIPARCAAFEIGALGVSRDVHRGLLAFIPLAEKPGLPAYQVVISTTTMVARLDAGGEQAGEFVEPEQTVLTVAVEQSDDSARLPRAETGSVPCHTATGTR